MEAALAARGDCLPTAGSGLAGAGTGAGRVGAAALLAGVGALLGAALTAETLAEWEGVFFTADGAALDAGLAATLGAGLATTGPGLPLALVGVGLAAGADF
jgi:hypothetical protein